MLDRDHGWGESDTEEECAFTMTQRCTGSVRQVTRQLTGPLGFDLVCQFLRTVVLTCRSCVFEAIAAEKDTALVELGRPA